MLLTFNVFLWKIKNKLYICRIKRDDLVPRIVTEWSPGHCYDKIYLKKAIKELLRILRNKRRCINKDLSGASAWTEWVETDGCNCSKVIFLHSDMSSEWLKNGRKDPSTCGKNPPCNYRMFDKCVRSARTVRKQLAVCSSAERAIGVQSMTLVRTQPDWQINYKYMKINIYVKTYKDKRILLPLDEFSWEKENKIFRIKLGIWTWALNISFNF